MTTSLKTPLILRELPCPLGWTAAVLETPLALEGGVHRAYHQAVMALLARLTPFQHSTSGEVLLQFDRMRPEVEIPVMQRNARYWQPEIGLGVWPHEGLPTTWTKEEFLAAAPGELRPVMYRVLRVQPDAAVQDAAFTALLGSGCLLRVATAHPGRFIPGSTTFFEHRILDPSLTSFPFYVPLLTSQALVAPHMDLKAPLNEWLPDVEGYLRESSEDGGLLLLVHQPRAVTLAELDHLNYPDQPGTPYLLMPDAFRLAHEEHGSKEGDVWR